MPREYLIDLENNAPQPPTSFTVFTQPNDFNNLRRTQNGNDNATRAGHGQYIKSERETYGRANGKHYCRKRYVVPLNCLCISANSKLNRSCGRRYQGRICPPFVTRGGGYESLGADYYPTSDFAGASRDGQDDPEWQGTYTDYQRWTHDSEGHGRDAPCRKDGIYPLSRKIWGRLFGALLIVDALSW